MASLKDSDFRVCGAVTAVEQSSSRGHHMAKLAVKSQAGAPENCIGLCASFSPRSCHHRELPRHNHSAVMEMQNV
jgi:hypothetical protein